MFAEVKRLNKGIVTKLAIATAIAVGVVIVTMFITVARPKHTQFCAKCHNNILFNNACKKSSPGDIACIECHTHENKGAAVMAVEIRDGHCTTESCHPLGKLSAKAVSYKKTKPFQHKTHAEKFDENLTLRCTSCHANLKGNKHFETDVNTCNICHFMNTTTPLYSQNRKPISDCVLCHGHVEKTREIYGKTFKHDLYEEIERVDCTDCHFKIVQGDGRVDKKSCYRCHKDVSDTFDNASDMHSAHIDRHKVACTSCHDSLIHAWVNAGDKPDGDDYDSQSVKANYKVQELIMMGKSGAGIEGEPDPMYLATLHCSACHKDKQGYANVKPDVCNNCHEKGFDKILTEQMRFVTSRMRLLKTLLTKAKRQYNADTNQSIQEAEMNYTLIKEDGSLGVHNIKYVKYLLDYSITNLQQVMKETL